MRTRTVNLNALLNALRASSFIPTVSDGKVSVDYVCSDVIRPVGVIATVDGTQAVVDMEAHRYSLVFPYLCLAMSKLDR